MHDVSVVPEWHYGNNYHYAVWVDGSKYDEFTSKGWLSYRWLLDVARGYAEGLDGYVSPC